MSSLNLRLIAFLDQNQIKYQYLKHAPTLTCEDAAGLRGTLPSQGAKAMLMLADQKPILVVLSGDQKIDTKNFKKQFKIKDIKFAATDQVESVTGCLPGAVPPFGNLFNVPVYVDQRLLENQEIAFNAGLRTASIIMKSSEFVSLVKPTIGTFAQN